MRNRRRLALLAGCAAATLVLTALGAALTPAHAVICANGGAGANSGDDSGQGSRTVCGLNATASGGSGSAFGNVSTASGAGSSAFGSGSTTSGSSRAAFGSSAEALGDQSTAVGRFAGSFSGTASGYTALGAFAGSDHTLGAFSTTIGGSNSDDFNPPRDRCLQHRQRRRRRCFRQYRSDCGRR